MNEKLLQRLEAINQALQVINYELIDIQKQQQWKFISDAPQSYHLLVHDINDASRHYTELVQAMKANSQ